MKTLTEQLKEAITQEFVYNSSKGESYCIYKAAMNCELIASRYFNNLIIENEGLAKNIADKYCSNNASELELSILRYLEYHKKQWDNIYLKDIESKNKELSDMQDVINKVKDICFEYLPKEKREELFGA